MDLYNEKKCKWTKIGIIDGLKRYDRVFFKPIVIANPMAHLTIRLNVYIYMYIYIYTVLYAINWDGIF